MIDLDRNSGTRRWSALTACLLLAVVGASPVAGQESGWNPLEARADRPALELLLTRYEAAARSPAYSSVLQAEAEDQARKIRNRLEQGDFRPGDRIYIAVEQHEPLTDTFAVAAGSKVALPGVGEVELAGVLRSELEGKVTESVQRTIRNPRVRTRSFVRLLIDGAVMSPGYYTVDSDAPLSDVLMRAGGQTEQARLEASRVERANEVFVGPDRFQAALRAGATVDQLGMLEGDRLYVPGSRSAWVDLARDAVYIIPAAIGIISLLL